MSEPLRLVAFKQERGARLLAQYLVSEGIEARYHRDQSDYAHQVQLLNPDKIEQAQRLCEEFIRDPNDPKFQALAWQSEPVKSTNSDLGLPKIRLSDAKLAPFTWLIFAFCCLVYAVSWLGGFGWVADHLKIIPLDHIAETSQWWRILTPALIHFSVIHIVFNLIWWGTLGKQIEQLFGTSTLIMLFVLSASLSNMGQLIVNGPNFGGLSGVVYATVGFVWFVGWLRPHWGLGLPKPMIGFLLGWLLLGYADVLWVQMANTAHTVGLISGCVFAVVLTFLSGQRRPS